MVNMNCSRFLTDLFVHNFGTDFEEPTFDSAIHCLRPSEKKKKKGIEKGRQMVQSHLNVVNV